MGHVTWFGHEMLGMQSAGFHSYSVDRKIRVGPKLT